MGRVGSYGLLPQRRAMFWRPMIASRRGCFFNPKVWPRDATAWTLRPNLRASSKFEALG